MYRYFVFLFVLAPQALWAASNSAWGLLISGWKIINEMITIAAAAAVLIFLYGLAKFLLKVGDSDSQKKARSVMIWGIVALFVMFSVWGLVALLQQSFGTDNSSAPTQPYLGDAPFKRPEDYFAPR